MNETTKANNCERAGDLVAYFYGEANSIEREHFNSHLAGCGDCRDELVALPVCAKPSATGAPRFSKPRPPFRLPIHLLRRE